MVWVFQMYCGLGVCFNYIYVSLQFVSPPSDVMSRWQLVLQEGEGHSVTGRFWLDTGLTRGYQVVKYCVNFLIVYLFQIPSHISVVLCFEQFPSFIVLFCK